MSKLELTAVKLTTEQKARLRAVARRERILHGLEPNLSGAIRRVIDVGLRQLDTGGKDEREN